MGIYVNDHDYYEFTADVTGSAVSVGTAVELVERVDGNFIPLVRPATADNNVRDDNARTTYVGVAMEAGEPGDRIAIRPWSSGTMPALVDTTTDLDAGADLFWNGTAFELVEATETPVTFDQVTSNGVDILNLRDTTASWTDDQWIGTELLIKAGAHEGERYRIHDNDNQYVHLYTLNLANWIAPISAAFLGGDWEKRTATNMSKITGATEPQICELLVLKGGRE